MEGTLPSVLLFVHGLSFPRICLRLFSRRIGLGRCLGGLRPLGPLVPGERLRHLAEPLLGRLRQLPALALLRGRLRGLALGAGRGLILGYKADVLDGGALLGYSTGVSINLLEVPIWYG